MKIKSTLRKLLTFNFKGFTLIELLVVITILGILAAGTLVAIDPIDKINSANDSKVQNDVSGMGRAVEAYAITHSGFYPATLNDLVTAGELKIVPVAPTGYVAYTVANSASTTPPFVDGSCVAGTTCTAILIVGELKSNKYKNFTVPRWNYDSRTGKSCPIGGFNFQNGGCP